MRVSSEKEKSTEGKAPRPLSRNKGGGAHPLLSMAGSQGLVDVCGVDALVLWTDLLCAKHFHSTLYLRCVGSFPL